MLHCRFVFASRSLYERVIMIRLLRHFATLQFSRPSNPIPLVVLRQYAHPTPAADSSPAHHHQLTATRNEEQREAHLHFLAIINDSGSEQLDLPRSRMINLYCHSPRNSLRMRESPFDIVHRRKRESITRHDLQPFFRRLCAERFDKEGNEGVSIRYAKCVGGVERRRGPGDAEERREFLELLVCSDQQTQLLMS